MKVNHSSDEVTVGRKKRVDLNYLRKISGNDHAFIAKTVETFFDRILPLIHELQMHMALKDWIKIRQLTHTIKSTLGMLGMHDLKEMILLAEEHSIHHHEKETDELLPLLNPLLEETLLDLKNEADRNTLEAA